MVDLSVISVTPEIFILEIIAPERIIVINLDRRSDRWTAMQESWAPDIVQRFTRFSATDGQLVSVAHAEANLHGRDISLERSAGEFGCRESWIRAVEPYGPGLYFEDDARPCQHWSYGPLPDEAEVVLLGGNRRQRVANPGWAPIRSIVWGAQAVWIRTQKAADSLIHAWRNPVDPHWSHDVASLQPLREAKAVLAVPQIVIQVLIDSDIDKGRIFRPDDVSVYRPWCSLKGGDPG